jgi:hypothetical protein
MPTNPYEPPQEVNEPRLWPWRREWRERRWRQERIRWLLLGALLLALVLGQWLIPMKWFR